MSSDDLRSPIETLEDSVDSWDIFFNRFFSPEIPAGVDVHFDPKEKQFKPRANQQAKYNHRNLPDGRTDHSDDFDDFLNNNTVTIPDDISLNQEGLDQVEAALKAGDYNQPCFEKPDHVFYALWLFKLNRISRQQMTTILARDQFSPEYPIVRTYQILDDKGQFTPEAVKILQPVLLENAYGSRSETLNSMERFRLLIQAAPKSERIFYLSTPNPQIAGSSVWQLGDALARNLAWHRVKIDKKKYDFHLSFAAIEGLQIAKHGIHGAAANRAKIGKVKIDDVKEGVEYFYRPTAISIKNSGVKETTENVHEYKYSPMPAVTAHDVFHSRLHNTMPPEYHMMMTHMAALTTKYTGRKWSKAKWELTDREFYSFVHNPSSAYSADQSARKLFYGIRGSSVFFDFDSDLNHGEVPLSDDGLAIAWDMISQPEVWEKMFKVNVDTFDLHLGKLRDFKNTLIKQDIPFTLISLKYRLYLSRPTNEYKYLSSMIDQYPDAYSEKLCFDSYARNKNNKNITTLKYKSANEQIAPDARITAKNAHAFMPLLVGIYLKQHLGQPNNDLVESQVNQIKPQLKSMHEGSQFSEDILQQSMQQLPSIMDKLSFLEASYQEIVQENKYTRRHKHVDKMFSFFKNPLTTSQRTHISMLKEQLNQTIQEHAETLPNAVEKDQFLWAMKTRKSDLAKVRTERFYLNNGYIPTSPKK